MAEGKRMSFTRKAAVNAVNGMMERVQAINEGNAPFPFLNKIRDVILFGSLVNRPDADKVHDADVAVIIDDDKGKMYEFAERYPEYCVENNYITHLFSEHIQMLRYLKGRKYLLSIHTNYEEKDSIMDIATSDKHIWLIKDYLPCTDVKSELQKLL